MTNPIEKAGKVLADSGVCPSPVAKNERTSARRAEIDAVIQLQASVRDLMSKIKNPAAKGQIDSLLLSLPPEYLSINQLEILKSEVQDAKNAANEAKEKDEGGFSALGLIAGAIGKVCDMFRSNDEDKAKCEHQADRLKKKKSVYAVGAMHAPDANHKKEYKLTPADINCLQHGLGYVVANSEHKNQPALV